MAGSRLSRSFTVEGKMSFEKGFVQIWGILLDFFAKYLKFDEVIN